MRYLLAAVATMAIATGPILAQPGNGDSSGDGKGNAQSAQSDRGQPGKADRGEKGRANDNPGSGQARRAEQAVPPRVQRAGGNANPNSGNTTGEIRREVRQADRRDGAGRAPDRARDRTDDVRRDRDRDGPVRYTSARSQSLIDGCPPGLAKKYNDCQPPGQARKTMRTFSPDYFGYSAIRDGRYFYDDGYLVRLGLNNTIASFLPLLGGALSVGSVWPASYDTQRVPDYLAAYYRLGEDDRYRYADDVIYRVDPESAAITSIAALLTGDEFVVGQPVPRGYDVYNVPYSFRDRYYDSAQANYRYSDGYVYEIDPETRLVAAAIELLA